MFAQPSEHRVELADFLEWVEARVGAHADADRARRQRDQPHPVALAHQVVGAVLADPRLRRQSQPLGVRRTPLLEVEPAGEPEPGGVDVVAGIGGQPELALDQRGSPGGVDDPPSGGRRALADQVERDPVRITEFDLLNTGSPGEVDATSSGTGGELVLEQATVDLIRLKRRVGHGTELDALGDIRVAGGRREEPQSAFDVLLLAEVVCHADHVREVVGPCRHGRLADLERRQRRGPFSLLEH